MRVVVSLAWARLRHRPTRWLLVALGVAAATVLPVLTQGIAASVAAQSLRYGVESLPPGDRSLAAIRSSVAMAPPEVAALDATARSALAPLTAGPVWAQMLTRTISDGVGGTYYFGAADGLSSLIRITEGRAPSSCTPTRCEVVVLGPGTPAPPVESGLVVVGRAVRTEPLLLAGSFDPGDGAPILLADGVTAAAQLTYLEQFQRAYAWVGPVDLAASQRIGGGRLSRPRAPRRASCSTAPDSASPRPTSRCAPRPTGRTCRRAGSPCSVARRPRCCSASESSARSVCAATMWRPPHCFAAAVRAPDTSWSLPASLPRCRC